MTDATDRLTSALQDRYRIERELGAGGMGWWRVAEATLEDFLTVAARRRSLK